MSTAPETLRLLRPGDEAVLEAFLAGHAASSMFLRANLRNAGLVDRGAVYQGTYAAVISAGAVAGVAAHFWNDMLVLQAPAGAERLAAAAVAASGRKVAGILGPLAQARAARQALGFAARATTTDSAEVLFRLELDRLRVPEALARGSVAFRQAKGEELGLLAEWRVAYAQETFRHPASPALGRASRAEVERLAGEGALFVLAVEGRPVSCCSFNARLPEMVQIGNVFTPPSERRRAYARAVVAGALKLARQQGVREAILFTGEENEPAQRAYRGIGFEAVGDYALILFAK
ncbi:MAG TPA: GNAT family N-acetyltransferase [Stellaceae bacterium]|nr:GNAT family N-acetyltransferase [Stellaceae bacterium]